MTLFELIRGSLWKEAVRTEPDSNYIIRKILVEIALLKSRKTKCSNRIMDCCRTRENKGEEK